MSTTSIQRSELTRSFMMSGPPLRLSVPAEFAAAPAQASVVNIGGFNGRVGRQIAFIPWHLSPETFDQSDRYRAVETVPAGDREVEIYQRVDGEQWCLLWRLASGIVMTHVRKDDGYEVARTVATKLEIFDEGEDGVTVLASEPLRRYAERRPGYQELIQLFATTDDVVQGYIEIRRPGNLARGARSSLETSAGETLQVGLRSNLEVAVEVHSSLAMSAETAIEGIVATYG